MKHITLSDDSKIPALGLGTWKSKKNEVCNAVKEALVQGYQHVDCAPAYDNENEVGDAIFSSIQNGVVKRDDLWVTSKLWNNAHAPENVEPALKKSLTDLRLDYLDLYLIHWPVAVRDDIFFPRNGNDYIPLSALPTQETWQAMEECVDKGLVKNIGVCNFSIKKLSELLDKEDIRPAVNQIELHPYLQQQEMIKYCKENNIILTAYSPLGSADRPRGMKKADEPSLLTNAVIEKIADKYAISPGQVLLHWGLQRGTVVIPKSVNPGRLHENLACASINFTFEEEDKAAIAELDQGYRYVDGSFWTAQGSPYTIAELWDEK